MSRKIPHIVKFFDDTYRFEFPDNQYYILQFDNIPSRYGDKNYYDKSLIDYFKENGFIEVNKIETRRRKYDIVSKSTMINTSKQILISIDFGSDKKDNLINIDYFYNIELGNLNDQLNLNDIILYKRTRKKSNISLVKSEMNQLDTEEFDIPIPEIDIELNYGKEFVKIHEVIVKRLNKDKDKGIILLHGDPGTGKCVVGTTKITIKNKITGKISEIDIKDLM